MTEIEARLRWNVRALALLRRTTRPIGRYPGPCLNAGEVKAAQAAYEANWRPIDFVRVLVSRDREARGAA